MLQDSLFTPRPAWLPPALAALHRHQYLTAIQLALLVEVPVDTLALVLQDLVHEGVAVALLPVFAPADRPVIPAFALTRLGCRLLRQTTGGPVPPAVDPRRSLYLLAHDLARNDLAVALAVLHRQGKIDLQYWETARARLADVAHVVERGHVVRVPLVGDGLALLHHHGTRTAFLVEIDRGTVSLARMRRKYRGYLEWWRDGGPQRRFGTSSLRVLTLAPAPRRLERLRKVAQEIAGERGSGLYWFAPLTVADPLHPERLLDPVWTLARPDGTPQFLLAQAA